MYLFTRRALLARGHGTAGLEWAIGMCPKVQEVTSQPVQLWGNVFSPAWGTVSWISWFEDLTSLEAVSDKLQADTGYMEMVDQGAELIEGVVDDGLVQVVDGQPEPGRPITYASGVVAACAPGGIEDGMKLGVELARRAREVTGHNTLFLRAMTGPYTGVGWLTGYENLAEYERGQQALVSDARWMELVDESEDAYVDDAELTQATLYRRLA